MTTRNISLFLDRSLPLEPENPLGSLLFQGTSGLIETDNIMLDTFLEALVLGLEKIEFQSHVVVDIIDEPGPLILELRDQTLVLKYEEQSSHHEDLEVFLQDLRVVIQELLESLDSAMEKNDKPPLALSFLRSFSTSS